MRPFTINNKKFKKEFLNDIKDGIIKRYRELYPNLKISIEYKQKTGIYKFFVYIDFYAINKNGIEGTKTLLMDYSNTEAISLFASIPLESFLEQYDDSRKDYRKEFLEKVEGFIVLYKTLGLDIKPIEETDDGYYIGVQRCKTSYSWLSNEHIHCYFKFDIVTIEEMKTNLSYVKNKLKKIYERGVI